MHNHFVGRWVTTILVALATLVSVSAAAQTPPSGYISTPAMLSPTWVAGTNVAPDSFSTPDAACRRKHAYFNPNATYLPPEYVRADVYGCRWELNENSNTILPSIVYAVCAQGGNLSKIGKCVRPRDQTPLCPVCQLAKSAPPQPTVGNPIALNYGAKIDYEKDYESADGLFTVEREYRSLDRNPAGLASPSEIAGFGSHWHGLIPGRLTVSGTASEIVEYLSTDGDLSGFGADRWDWSNYNFGTIVSTRRKLSMVATPPVHRVSFFQTDASILNGPAEMRLDMPNGEYILFRRAGAYQSGDGVRYLVPIEQGYPSGYKKYFDYLDTGEFPNKVRDSFGREMNLTWADAGWNNNQIYVEPPSKVITEITLPDATKLTYTYGFAASGADDGKRDRLESVQRLSATSTILWARTYLYENATYPSALTGMRDQNGARLSTYTYDAAGLATSTEKAGGVAHYTVENYENETITNGVTYNLRRVTNPLGRVEDYVFRNSLLNFGTSPQLLDSITGQASAHVPASLQTFGYSGSIGDFAMTTTTDPRGNSFGLGNDAGLRPTLINDAYNTAQPRPTNLTWDPVLDLVTREVRGSLQIDYVYSTTGLLQSLTETDISSQSVPYSTNGQTRTWTYGWSTKGRLLSVNGPKGLDAQGKDDTFTFTYDATQGKDLLTVTNGLGQVTTFAGHDANGRPATMTDPNGIVTAFTYDGLGRTKTINRKHPTTGSLDAITTLDYDVEGRVIGVTMPSTDKLFIDYDLAGRMTAVRAASGERIDYGYDAMGNVTSETTKRIDTTTARAITRTFDELGRMLTETLGAGRTTTWAYDKNGNPTQVTTARSNATVAAFDPLNRLISATAPDTGVTTLAYNPRDEAVSHVDPLAVTTSFVRNGFGDVIQEVSPDRGTSTYYFDAAGGMTASIDGRGQRIDYVLDALGRVKTKTPVGKPASEIVTYTYDTAAIAGSYGVGRLATVVDGSGTTRFKYDHRGNVLTKQQTIGTTTLANLAYVYDLADRITQITYPSGRLVGYVRDTKGRVTTVQTKATAGTASWTSVASSIQYEAFGSLKQATLGNTLSLTQAWGNDGRLASKRLYKTSTGVNVSLLTYAYDNDDNITSITDGVTATNSPVHSYDTMGHLSRTVVQTGTYKREDYLFDKNGNRTSVERRVNAADASPAQTDTYTRASGTNRLASVALPAGTRSISYDNRGNTASEARPASVSATVTYDGHGRLTGYVRTGDATQANVYNGLDDRVVVTSGSTVRRFLYDAGGRVLGEYGTSATNVIAERIWMAPEVDEPGLLFGGDDGVGGQAPVALVVGSTLRWVHGSHLGVPLVYTSSTGATIATPTYTLPGFPGQLRTYADLYYNRYRDYDTTTGRYIQADPIGLSGDPNPYLYALGNPVTGVDPWGLNAGLIRGAAIGGKIAGDGLWMLCQRFPQRCMATIGRAAVWVYRACPQILEMAKPTGKERATDYPSWVDQYQKDPGEDCERFAEEILNDKRGVGNWRKGPGSEYSKIVKACRRGGLR
ncbi:MAG: RHS repeat protein [Sphingomonadales bacterium]|nr:RHS repeat protein [Sphingomonadales bacterium]MBK6492519.1 RHS repeat protein [Sphingomonadales bacterium]MBK6720608.1 RHS repeat protein [Sphingomonadales bacterium]